MTGDFNWKEMSDIVHAIREERVIMCGAIKRLDESKKNLEKADKKLKRIEEKLNDIILRHKDE